MNTQPQEIVLKSGEKAALTKGFLVVTREQAAVCYVVSQSLDRQVNFGGGIDSTQLYIECGMNKETFRRLVAKFVIISNDQQEDEEVTSGERISEKELAFHTSFSDMTFTSIFDLALTAFTFESKVLGQQEYQKYLKSKEVSKELKNKIQFNSTNLYRQLVKHTTPKSAISLTIKKIAKELSIEESQVKNNWDVKNL